MQEPQINPKSEYLANAIRESTRDQYSRVEDRLLGIGRMWREKKEQLTAES